MKCNGSYVEIIIEITIWLSNCLSRGPWLIHGWPHRDLGCQRWWSRSGVHRLSQHLVDEHPNELEELKDADNGEAKEETNGTTHIGQDAAKCVLGKVLDNHGGPGVIIDLDPQKAKMKVRSHHLYHTTYIPAFTFYLLCTKFLTLPFISLSDSFPTLSKASLVNVIFCNGIRLMMVLYTS